MKPRGSVEERLWRYIIIDEECWLWTGHPNEDGYGTIKVEGKSLLAHRVSYELYIGPIEGEIDHLCRNRDCVQPLHLEDVTHLENMQRAPAYVRTLPKTHCPQGHKYTSDNIYMSGGYKKCKVCVKARVMSRHNGLKDDPNYLEKKRESARNYMRRIRSAT